MIKDVPPGDFEEISIQMPQWEKTFQTLVKQGKLIKYQVYSMPNLSESIQDELSKGKYCNFVLEDSDWHFLVPKSVK